MSGTTLARQLAAVLTLTCAASWANAGDLQQTVASATGAEASTAENGVVRIGWTRDEVPVRISGTRLEPPAGLGSWAAFKRTDDGVVVTGDTVVFEDEIAAAMDAAFAHGLEVTALHNHFIYDDPPVYFMHISGSGTAEELGSGVKAVWKAIRSVRDETPDPRRRLGRAVPEAGGEFDTQALADILGSSPQNKDGVVKFTFPRKGRLRATAVGGPMGLSTWAAFSGSQEKALVDGDFIMTAGKVQEVMRTLRDHDIQVVALHNHMIHDEPQFFFLHYIGVGPAADLARGVKAALRAQ